MKLFECQVCGNALHFENVSCVGCGSVVAYLPARFEMTAVLADGETLTALADPGEVYRLCANAAHGVCNCAGFSDASMHGLSARHNGWRRRSAKARSRGR
jgi:hypothetical protein